MSKMSKPTKSASSLDEAMQTEARRLRNPRLSWFELLTNEQRDELTAVGKKAVAGEYGVGLPKVARMIVTECKRRGIPVSGYYGVYQWLVKLRDSTNR